MGDATGHIAVVLAEETDIEHHVVEDEKEHRPLHERYVETFQTAAYECALVVKVAQGEEIAGAGEEQGHVKLEDETVQQSVAVGMGHHHEDDANGFGYGYSVVATHGFFRFVAYPKRARRASSTFLTGWMVISNFDASRPCILYFGMII